MSSPSYIQPKAVHASDHFKSNLQTLLHGGGKSPAPFIMPEFRPQSSSAQPAPYNAFQNMVSQSPMPRVSVPRQLSQLKPKQPFAVVCAASDAALQMNDEMAAVVRSPLRSAAPAVVVRQPMAPPTTSARAAPAPAAAATSALSAEAERNTVVLRDWSFAKLVANSKHLGFRAVGTLAYHPRVNDSSFGSDWFSTEIRDIHSNGVVVSSNMSLYRLDGPAAPARHNAQPRLAAIMQPFCRSTWPPNAQSLFEQVSKFFRSDEYVATPPQPSRAVSTPSSAPADRRAVPSKNSRAPDDEEEEDDVDDDDEEEPPPRRKVAASSKPKPRAANAPAKASASKTKVKSDGKFKPSSASSRSSAASSSGPSIKAKPSARASASSYPSSKTEASSAKAPPKKKKRLSILKQPEVIVLADDTDGPVDSIAKRSVTSRGRVSRRPLEFWKNERFEYDINKEVKSFSQASLPPTPVRQPSFSDASASDSKSHASAPARAAPPASRRQQAPAAAARTVSGSRKRIIESSSESEPSSSDDDSAPIVQKKRVQASAKASAAAKSSAGAKAAAASRAPAAAKASASKATKPAPSSKAPVSSKAKSSQAPPPRASSALPQRVRARQPALAVASSASSFSSSSSSSESEEELPVPRRSANAAPASSHARPQAPAPSKQKPAPAPRDVSAPSPRKPAARGGKAEPAAAAPIAKGATAKSGSSRGGAAAAAAAAQSDSDSDIFEKSKLKAPLKKPDNAAVKFSTASALLSSEPADGGDDDDWHPANLAKLVHAVQACPPTPGGFWNEVAKHVGKSAAACRNRFFSEQSTPAPSKPKRQRRRPTTEVVNMARPGTLKHREQFRANVENLNEGHEDDFFESTPWRGAADQRDTLFQDDDLELPLVGFLDAHTLKKVLDADKGDDLFRAEPSPGLLNSVRRSNLDRYIVNLKQKAREGAGKRTVSAASPAASNKQSTKRSRAEEEGKWDAVSKAIQKTARQDAASDGSDDAEDSAGSSSS